MHKFSFSHLSDGDLLQSARHEFGCRRLATARFLAQLGEIDARKLYLPLAYDSMHSFCSGEFRMSTQQAYKWIQVARAGRRFPALLDAIADGRLSRCGVVVLAPHLREETIAPLLHQASGKTKADIERLLTSRAGRAQDATPQSDGPTQGAGESLSLGIVGSEQQLSPGIVECEAPAAEKSTATSLADLAPQTHPIHLRLDDEALELLRYAPGAARACRALSRCVEDLQALAAGSGGGAGEAQVRGGRETSREPARLSRPSAPHFGPRPAPGLASRWRPVHVREPDRQALRFDPTTRVRPRRAGGTRRGIHRRQPQNPVPGPQSARSRARIRRRVHEGEARGRGGRREAAAREKTKLRVRIEEVIPWLRQLGFGAKESSEGAALTAAIADAPLEERVRLALSHCGSIRGWSPRPVTTSPAPPLPAP